VRNLLRSAMLFCLAVVVPGTRADADSASAAATPREFHIPLRTIILPFGDLRYSMSITIGGRKIDAMVDTGSNGLRVLARSIPSVAVAGKAGPLEAIAYGAGDVLIGPIVSVDTGLAPQVDAVIPLQVIVNYQCMHDRANCAASLLHPEEYEIGGERVDGQGFDAIIGIEMPQAGAKKRGLVNPLILLGRSWIVTLPMPGDDETGSILVNPTQEERSRFTLYPLDPRLRDQNLTLDDAVTACLKVAGYREFCAPTTMDSGAPAFAAYSDNVTRGGSFQTGTAVELDFHAPRGTSDAFRFTVEDYPAKHVMALPLPKGEPAHIESGILPYQYFSVLYDMDANAIGLAPRK
jgi:hypothetical protein